MHDNALSVKTNNRCMNENISTHTYNNTNI